MPGRVSVRSQRSAWSSGATIGQKSSTQALRTARSSAAPVEIPEEGQSTSLREQICTIFAEAQRNASSQRKLVVRLRGIQENCCYEVPRPQKKGKKTTREDEDDFDENDFNHEIGRCVARILPIKKSEPVGDRIVRFLGLFLKLASERGKNSVQTISSDEVAHTLQIIPSPKPRTQRLRKPSQKRRVAA